MRSRICGSLSLRATQAVMMGSGKAMVANAVGVKPMRLQDSNGIKLELADMLYITNFKKKIISLSKLLDQGYKVNEWTKEYFWLSKGAMGMQVQRKAGYAMYYFQVKPMTGEAYIMAEHTMDINERGS